MNIKDALKIEEDKLRSQEPELLVKHTAEMQSRDAICGRKLSSADKIARAIMHITSLYGQAIKKARGGWSCGTHMNHVRTALSHKIASKYNDEQLLRFIEAYEAYANYTWSNIQPYFSGPCVVKEKTEFLEQFQKFAHKHYRPPIIANAENKPCGVYRIDYNRAKEDIAEGDTNAFQCEKRHRYNR